MYCRHSTRKNVWAPWYAKWVSTEIHIEVTLQCWWSLNLIEEKELVISLLEVFLDEYKKIDFVISKLYDLWLYVKCKIWYVTLSIFDTMHVYIKLFELSFSFCVLESSIFFSKALGCTAYNLTNPCFYPNLQSIYLSYMLLFTHPSLELNLHFLLSIYIPV